jgi:uncharacterized membrane protein
MKKHPRFPKHQHPPLAQYPGTARIEAFSDGVMAIIITIMVLELRVPKLAEAFTRDEFWQEMAHFWPKLLTYAMSFIIVGIFWVNHHGFFHSLQKSDGKLLWYNNFMLFWLSLIPFGTAFLGEHPTSPEAIMIFASILAVSAISFPFMGYYAMFQSDLMDDSITTEMRYANLRRSWPGSVLYLIAVLVAPYSIWVSWGIFFIVPVYYFLPRRIGEEGE